MWDWMCKAIQAASHFRVPLGLVHFNAQRTDFTVYSTQADTRAQTTRTHARTPTRANYPHTHPHYRHTTLSGEGPARLARHRWQRQPCQLGAQTGACAQRCRCVALA